MFTTRIIAPDVTSFLRFIAQEFPEVQLQQQQTPYGLEITFVGMAYYDAKAIEDLWLGTLEKYTIIFQ